MSFRARISLVIFLVGLLPTLAVLIFSSYLLNSTLNRVGAAGLETSLQSADTLVDQTQEALARLLAAKLPDNFGPWSKPEYIEDWRKTNHVDLAFFFGYYGFAGLTTSDSLPRDKLFISSLLKAVEPALSGGSRISHYELGNINLLIFIKKDTSFWGGCGILMPSGYDQRGKVLANSISASASLGIYKLFSLKFLAAISVLAIILFIILGLFLSAAISRQLAKPLEKLSFGAKIIGAGNLDYKVDLDSRDEFSGLAESFNKMAVEIKDNQRRLLESERLAAWREVARRIAHEIKNPLTPINIQLYRLEEQLQNNLEGQAGTEALHSLEAIRSQIITLQNLAQHFSAFAKEPELKRLPCSLPGIITETVNSFSSNNNLEIITNIANDIPNLNLDAQMMTRVFINLIKNSIEARPDAVRIEISAKSNGEYINVTLRDNGPGFPAEKLERIDQPYITSKPTGTGLGLLIIKKIIEEHGGQIRFYNDCGAVVEMSLPG